MAPLPTRRRLFHIAFCVGIGIGWLPCGRAGVGTSRAMQSGDAQVAGSPAPIAAAAVDSGTTTPTPQRDVMDILAAWILHRRVEPQLEAVTSTGIAWSLLPTLSYNPTYGFAFGASASGAGIVGNSKNSRPSALFLAGNYSTTGQVQAQFRCDFYTASGNYLLKADFRYLDTERSTWGLGPITGDQEEFPMEFKLIRTYATFCRRAAGSVFVGLGYHFDEYADIVDSRAALGDDTPFAAYSGPGVTHTQAAGFSINLLGDTRDNLVNPTRGYYLSGTFRDYLKDLGSDDNWQEFWLDVRIYPHLPVRSNNILAFWVYNWFTFGPAPYLDLPASGWDTQGRGARGYLQGRIRGEDQMYTEVEYRASLTRDGLLGAVAFYNITATATSEEGVFGRADHGFGLGLRLKFNKRSNTNLALDHAWGESNSRGWYMGMTEVF